MVLSAARLHLLGGIRLGAWGQHLLRGSRLGAWGQHLLRGSRPGALGQHLLRGIGSVHTDAEGFQEKEIREKLQAFPGGSIDLVKQESGIAVLTVNNPARMNAFSGSMMVELEERVSQLEEWTEGKGLIIHGAAGTFCSGSDLNAVRAISNPQVSPQCCQRYIQPSGQSSMLSEIYPTLRSVLNVVRDISNPQVSPQCYQRYIQPSGQSSMLSEIYPTLRSVLNVVRDISNPQVSPQCCQRYIQPSGQSSMLSEIYPTLGSVSLRFSL
ncbi:ethylmalonyl-CoA decarboxylase isoform X1 [Oncorhynchus keta]|uniref:ethylmalonyl-CoA decarboxylase isoform X1 n=1 Tax=Oncorhynchus keta TaxID=8018 RepID=UPI00227A3503|nr:ethylmalonyl-CoA decarboxylase isoform X1 [Oncorhynchus keta]XP_052363490.1 ethylmalonyl-CoA decarboxylase isoform X1 [Oncorhynchus keta]XP_052363491.1 ethylmalonyl-CoA decarboxylase isoform X1 [Oncorhynchus keta]XP_052363492.1 ethylmalonyl-CoA decarboxylase isoform X1 [Oncorhynchus keta]XP_052363493.1 ethylmalonyl-CoA decarboxylase isoform X1 [Oncorhynchus keta]XP_052363494.1 ethylmalonyl-CoA decarboxylase isoform X1 [Oncorhynchus keta]XP_052363495.1 ethylmalonyl-CoA decarboxylase isoform